MSKCKFCDHNLNFERSEILKNHYGNDLEVIVSRCEKCNEYETKINIIQEEIFVCEKCGSVKGSDLHFEYSSGDNIRNYNQFVCNRCGNTQMHLVLNDEFKNRNEKLAKIKLKGRE